MRQYIGFKLNASEYTLPILRVREIINTPPVTRLPQSPSYVRGVINLRGSITPVIDLKALISQGESALEGTKVIILIAGGKTFGILVDAITSVINIEDTDIEPPGEFIQASAGRVEGVARLKDRLLILLNTDRIVDTRELDSIEGRPTLEAGAYGQTAPRAQGAIEGPDAGHAAAGQVPSAPEAEGGPSLKSARDVLTLKFGSDERKNNFIKSVVDLIDTLASHDYDKADVLIVEMMKNTGSESGLYKEVGKVTRKLHDTLSDFKSALDPRLRDLTDNEIPSAIDNLQFVIKKTEEAANTTMEVVEKYISGLPEATAHAARIKSPKPSSLALAAYFRDLHADLNRIMVAQEVQDITGQTIKRVIDLVNAIEAELIALITTFGVKIEERPSARKPARTLTQDEIDSLLKEFGF